MRKFVKRTTAGISLFLFIAALPLAAQQKSAPATPPQAAAEPSAESDHARAYYHYMLARRYKELAGMYNRSDYADRAISEYKQALEADPQSLFLRVELAELYWRVTRVADAVREAEAVLKIDPDYPDAHRLLGHIYVRLLGDPQQPPKAGKESLKKAIEHFEALTRLNPTDADSWVMLGRLYKFNNQGDKAEEAFKKVLGSDPESRAALANLAQLYSDQGDYDQAIELLTRIPGDEMDAQLYGLLGYAYTQARDFDKAAATYEKALTVEPDNTELRRAYAEVLMSAGKSAASRTELQKILRVEPEDGPTYLRLAQLDRQEGRFDQARQDLERARALLPDNLEVAYQQVLLEDDLGNDDKAVEILQGLLKQSEHPDGKYSPGDANNRGIFLERLGLIYRQQEKYPQAIDAFGQMEALGKSQAPRAEGLIIETLRLNREPKKAMEAADSAVAKYPDDRPLKILRATLLGEQGRVDEAAQQLQSLIKGTPGDLDLQLSLAQIYSQARRFPEAEAAAKKALELSSRPEDKERATFLLGAIYERQKKYDPAEEQFKKILTADPLNAAAANYLGYMLADRGVRLQESLQYIQKAVELEPNNGAYLDSLGWAYFKLNRLDKAAASLEKAARLISSDPTIHEHLGRLYLQMGKKAQAQQEWERALAVWPGAVGSDFDTDEAAKLRQELNELKAHLARDKASQP